MHVLHNRRLDINPNSVENLANMGHAYMRRTAPRLQDVEYVLHAVTNHSLARESNDGSVHEIAMNLVQHDELHPAQVYLDEPLWVWNESLK